MAVVSIVTPFYCGAQHIGETIASVCSQTLLDLDYIIVDDGSPDDATSILMPFTAAAPRLRILSQSNAGAGAARNTGYRASHAASRHVLFLDQDDVLESNMLASLVDYLDRYPTVGLAFCERSLIDDDSSPLPTEPLMRPIGAGALCPAKAGARAYASSLRIGRGWQVGPAATRAGHAREVGAWHHHAGTSRTMTERPNGTVALVTGSSSGIGAATAASLAAQGAAVALVARRKDRLDTLAASIREQGGTALVLESDVTDEQQATEAIQRTVAEFGRLDTLISRPDLVQVPR